jgi:hypothetical protein
VVEIECLVVVVERYVLVAYVGAKGDHGSLCLIEHDSVACVVEGGAR